MPASMLGTAPPAGYNTSAVNQQNVAAFNTPGLQGAIAQGYNPYKSSYALPSSYHIPSSIDAPNPYYQQPIQQSVHPQAAQMARALRGQ